MLIQNRILKILGSAEPLKAKKLAALLGIETKSLNPELYRLKNLGKAAIDDSYRWSIVKNKVKQSKQAPTTKARRSPAPKVKVVSKGSEINKRCIKWDQMQRLVFEGNEDTCLLVEAGPGSGKTAVACKRVAWLVEECDVESSKILLISFTRTAVRELQNRIESHATVPLNVAGVRIVTLDSFTWQVVSGLGDVEFDLEFASYEDNIMAFTNLLKSKDKGVRDFLGELEHIVVDEAQDLVGVRADLVIELIKSLPQCCGVTVFGDSAQAIYGFTDDSGCKNMQPSTTAIDQILSGDFSRFEEINLESNHRTNDIKLRELCSKGRQKLLLLKEGTAESWKWMRSLIQEKAHGEANDENLDELSGRTDALVLYRSRAEAIMASSMLWSDGIEHKLRMSRVPVRIHPWIGRVFGEFVEDTIRETEFMTLWTSRICSGGEGADAAWKLLKRFAYEHGGIVRLAKLRSVLGRSRPPLDFLVDERDLPGPVVGTIHASKGMEAAVVRLMLPSEKYVDRQINSAALAEEERVLFVGATRAKEQLLVGSGIRTYAKHLQSGRVFRATRGSVDSNKRQVEIGLQGDVSAAGMVSSPLDQAEVKKLQEWLWRNRSTMNGLESRYQHDEGLTFLYNGPDTNPMRIGRMSAHFGYDLFAIAKEIGYKSPSAKIKNLRMVGVSTTVIAEAEREAAHLPWKRSAFALIPVITGFPVVFFNH